MKYRYFYQTKTNENREGEIRAANRAEAYAAIRKLGIHPYRVLGDDPVRWQPWAISAAFLLMLAALLGMSVFAIGQASARRKPVVRMTEAEAINFRSRAEAAVMRAPEAFRFDVWKGVNARLEERGLDPLPRPAGLIDPDLGFGE